MAESGRRPAGRGAASEPGALGVMWGLRNFPDPVRDLSEVKGPCGCCQG